MCCHGINRRDNGGKCDPLQGSTVPGAHRAAQRHLLWQEQNVLSSRWMEVRSGW